MGLVKQIDFSTAVVGTTGTVDFTQFGLSTTPADLQNRAYPAFGVYNESGCGLACVFIPTGQPFFLPAGGWVNDFPIMRGESGFTYTVSYVLANAPVSQLFISYRMPWEAPIPAAFLGNSPIGLSGVISAVTNQVINNGNPAVTQVVEGTPSTGPNAGVSSLSLNNDGSGFLSGNKITFDNVGNLVVGAFINFGAGIGGSRSLLDWDAANMSDDYWSPQSGASPTGHLFLTWNGSAQKNVFSVGGQFGSALTWLGSDGHIGAIAGQATVSTLGVPVLVAQSETTVTTTGDRIILSFAVASTGQYRVSAQVDAIGTNPATITLNVHWVDPANGATPIAVMAAIDSFASSINVLNGYSFAPQRLLPCMPLLVRAKSGANIDVHYNNSTGTPNDAVSVTIERLS